MKLKYDELKTKSKPDLCAVRLFFASLKIYPSKDLYYIRIISYQQVNNYNFSVLMKKRMHFSMFLIFERVSNKGNVAFSCSYIIFVLTSGIFQNDKW